MGALQRRAARMKMMRNRKRQNNLVTTTETQDSVKGDGSGNDEPQNKTEE